MFPRSASMYSVVHAQLLACCSSVCPKAGLLCILVLRTAVHIPLCHDNYILYQYSSIYTCPTFHMEKCCNIIYCCHLKVLDIWSGIRSWMSSSFALFLSHQNDIAIFYFIYLDEAKRISDLKSKEGKESLIVHPTTHAVRNSAWWVSKLFELSHGI